MNTDRYTDTYKDMHADIQTVKTKILILEVF